MNACDIWTSIDLKLIAILRGIQPEETVDVVSGLLGCGIRAIEIPMNSPNAIKSIEMAVQCAREITPDAALIGAGTVLSATEVDAIAGVGGNLIVSPNINPEVVTRAIHQKAVCLPGVFTASEAHLAVSLGATALKFFPASHLGASGIKAIAATLPKETQLCAVGGVDTETLSDYRQAGVTGFGLGSNLYKPGTTTEQVVSVAKRFIEAYYY